MDRSQSDSTDTRTHTESLVEHCLAISNETMTEAARKRAHVLFRDGLGVILGSATTTDSSEIARDMVDAVYGPGDATIAGGKTAPTPAAAFANGTILHGIELDDTHSGSSAHPGAVIIPTILAVGESEGATGTDALEAMVAGYECMLRIGRAADPASLYDRGFHPTSCTGVFGAALAAGKLKGLSEDEIVNAVGIAGSFAGGNLEYLAEGVLSKRIQPGNAAHAGIVASELAARGYTGPRTILSGKNGFFSCYSDNADPTLLLADIDDDAEFEITRTGIKPHACCRYNQTPIDAVLQLKRDHGFTPDEVESVTVEIVDAAIVLVADPDSGPKLPATTTDAQFSLPYSVSVALLEDQAFLEQFREPYLSSERVREFIGRVTVEHGEDLETYYPDFFPARATVRTTSGDTYTTMLKTCRGEPENPLSEDELTEKYETLAGRYLADDAIDCLERLATDLPAVDTVETITEYLRG